jgi:acetyl esterase
MSSPPDYARLIDAETWAFIRETERWYPPDAAGYPIARQREVYDAMSRAFDVPRPAGVGVTDGQVAGVPCRHYAPPGRGGAATVVYLHGGGYVVGGLDSHDGVCAEICAETALAVVSADYRLSPEHLHPAAFGDACAVIRAVAGGGPVVLAGDSAGANLCAAAAQALRPERLPILGQVLIYPGLGGDDGTGSYVTHGKAPMLTRDDLAFYAGIRFAGGVVPAGPDPTARPLDETDYTGMPPTLCIAAECDPLADDGTVYAARIVAAGGRAAALTEAGLVHGWLRARHTVGRARESFARIIAAIAALSRGDWPAVRP